MTLSMSSDWEIWSSDWEILPGGMKTDTRPQTRSHSLRFRGQNTFSEGKDFCSYYIFNAKYSEHSKIWSDAAPEFLPRGYGPAESP